jgi:hypothetical protein
LSCTFPPLPGGGAEVRGGGGLVLQNTPTPQSDTFKQPKKVSDSSPRAGEPEIQALPGNYFYGRLAMILIMKNFLHFKKEHHKYGLLVILSIITGTVEFFGFEATNSNALGISIAHMLFHAVFFGTLFIFSYFFHHKNIKQEEKIEKLISYGTIVLVIVLGIFRIHELLDHTFEQMIFGNMATLRWYLVFINGLVFLQWYVLHAKTENNSCEALCHGSEGHLLIDCIGFIILFWVTFTGSFISSIADTGLFIISGIILVLTVIRIIKNLNKKYQKRVH